jgi:hypothetical protein
MEQKMEQLIDLLQKKFADEEAAKNPPRPSITDKMSPSKQQAYDPFLWIKATTGNILINGYAFVVAAVLYGEEFEENAAANEDLYMWCFVRGPLVLMIVLTFIIMNKFMNKMGLDTLQECSVGKVSIKDSVVNSCTNTATLGALFLGFTLAMLQVGNPDPPGEDLTTSGPMDIRSMWYTIYLSLASVLCLNAVVSSSILLYYTGGLSEDACLQCIVDNINYMGDPMVSIGLAVFFTCDALVIWIFQATNDFWITLFILIFVWYPGTVKATGVWMYLSRWQNNIDGPANEQERLDRLRIPVGKDLCSYS